MAGVIKIKNKTQTTVLTPEKAKLALDQAKKDFEQAQEALTKAKNDFDRAVESDWRHPRITFRMLQDNVTRGEYDVLCILIKHAPSSVFCSQDQYEHIAVETMKKLGHGAYDILEAMVEYHPKKVDARTLAYHAEDMGLLDLSTDLANLCT